MNLDDEKLESYLRQFRPRQPKPLPGKGRLLVMRFRVPVLAAGVAAVALCVVLLVLRGSKPNPRVIVRDAVPHQQEVPAREDSAAQQITLGRLSVIAKQEPEKLDAHLERVSQSILPDVRAGHGVLRALSAE
jgi:hypothetical protein